MVDSHARRCVFLTMAFPLVAENEQAITFERFAAFVRHYRAVENQFSLLDKGAPQREEINRLWSELRPSHNKGEASISPAEFVKLPGLLASKRFRPAPSWALRDANCELLAVRREDLCLVEPDGQERRLTFEDDLQKLAEERAKVVVMRVRALMGDEKLLSHCTVKQRVVTDAWHHLRRAHSTAAVIAKQSPFSPSAVAKRRDAKTTVWAGGIPPGTDASAVEQLFQQFGRCDVVLRQKPTKTNWALVHYGHMSCVAAVLESDLELSGVALSLRPVDVKLLEQKASGQRSFGMSSEIWDNTQNELQLDWSGVPLVWRRETDTIQRELVKFEGVVTKASNDAGTVDVWCSFQEGDADEAAAPRTLTDRFLRGGLVPGLRAFLLRPWTERLITAVIIFSLM